MKKIILLLALFISTVHADIYDIKDFNLENYKGKVIYLDFWASWCRPCQKSFPWMNSLKDKFPLEKFEVITVNLDQNSEAMHNFLERIPANFKVYHDASGKIAEQFELKGMPTSFLINTDGKIITKHKGFYTNKTDGYEKEIEELL